MEIFERLKKLLTDNNARFTIMAHAPVGRSEEVSAIRGTLLGQGAKAMLCRVNITASKRAYILAIVPADQKVDLTKVAHLIAGKKASLASEAEICRLTQCVIGAIPPFSFHEDMLLAVDQSLIERFSEIAFNAGRLDHSIVLNSEDYLKIVQPRLCHIIV